MLGASLIQNKPTDDLTKLELVQERERLLALLINNESEAMTAGDCARLSEVTQAIKIISRFQKRHRSSRDWGVYQ